MTPHKHCEVIKALAEGQEIQTRLDASVPWTDVVSDSPSFSPAFEYRIKPKTVKREGWVNIYRSHRPDMPETVCCVHPSEKIARGFASDGCLATVKIEWSEDD